MFNIMENNLLFTKKNDNDRITMVYCEKTRKGEEVNTDGRFMADGIQTASTPEKADSTAECTSFGPEKAGRERTNEQTGTGKEWSVIDG